MNNFVKNLKLIQKDCKWIKKGLSGKNIDTVAKSVRAIDTATIRLKTLISSCSHLVLKEQEEQEKILEDCKRIKKGLSGKNIDTMAKSVRTINVATLRLETLISSCSHLVLKEQEEQEKILKEKEEKEETEMLLKSVEIFCENGVYHSKEIREKIDGGNDE